MDIFFASDHHFGHENIIEYCKRPFQSYEEMDSELISRWNERVKQNDIVYHLGDFTLGDKEQARYYFSRLNGIIHVLANNSHHDKRWLPKWNLAQSLRSRSGSIIILKPLITLEFPELMTNGYPQIIVLCHFPLARWDRSHYGAWHLYGHSHGNFENGGLSYDVGVDKNDFYPVSIEEVIQIMRKSKQNDNPDEISRLIKLLDSLGQIAKGNGLYDRVEKVIIHYATQLGRWTS